MIKKQKDRQILEPCQKTEKTVEHEGQGNTNCNGCAWNGSQVPGGIVPKRLEEWFPRARKNGSQEPGGMVLKSLEEWFPRAWRRNRRNWKSVRELKPCILRLLRLDRILSKVLET